MTSRTCLESIFPIMQSILKEKVFVTLESDRQISYTIVSSGCEKLVDETSGNCAIVFCNVFFH